MRRLVLMVMLVAVLLPMMADKVPSAAELKKARPLIVELMRDDEEALRTKKTTPSAVADAAVKYADDAQTSAEKYLLLRTSVFYYTRDKKYDQAADTVNRLKEEFPELGLDEVADLIAKATTNLSMENAPRLFTMWRSASMQARALKEVRILRAQLKKAPADDLRRKYAEALAATGDWKKALEELAKLQGADGRRAREEIDGTAKNAELGDYWWKYEPANEKYESTFRRHAACCYRRAIDKGEITGLQRKIVEKRIAEVPEEETAVAPANSAGGRVFRTSGDTAWLKLKDGSKIEFTKIEPGEFKYVHGCYGDFKVARITRPYWIAKDLLSLEQYTKYGLDSWAVRSDMKKANDNSIAYADYPCTALYKRAVSFTDNLTLSVRDSLPRGYVVRLQSIAEWQCALSRCGGDIADMQAYCGKFVNKDARIAWTRETYGEACSRERVFSLRNWKNGNKLGLRNLYRSGEWVCDLMDFDKMARYEKWPFIFRELPCDVMEDPFYYCDWSEKTRNIFVETYFMNTTFTDAKSKEEKNNEGICSRVRLVIGPDLVGEWKAKNAKK